MLDNSALTFIRSLNSFQCCKIVSQLYNSEKSHCSSSVSVSVFILNLIVDLQSLLRMLRPARELSVVGCRRGVYEQPAVDDRELQAVSARVRNMGYRYEAVCMSSDDEKKIKYQIMQSLRTHARTDLLPTHV